MKTDQRLGYVFVCFAILITIATMMVIGCTDSAPNPQEQVTVSGGTSGEHSTASIGVTTKATVTPSPQKTVPQTPVSRPSTTKTPASTSDPSEQAIPNGIIIDSICDITAGDPLVVSGRTSLPPGTNLIVKVVPVTMNKGTIAGDFRNTEKSAVTKVTAGSANGDRFSITLETGNLPFAEHIVFVSDMDDEAAGSTSEPTGVTGSALFSVIGR
ncbi:MAG: hypothetical protein WC295_08730 [Methanoregula sp.]|nr:hypothetical protein [Methanoregula sp.]